MADDKDFKSKFEGSKLHVGMLHPDLGLGGAERLVVDCAVELQSRGHLVTMYTSHHDPGRCFEETLSSDGARAPWVRVAGGWIPRHVLGRAHALMAYLRSLWTALVLIFCCKPVPDVIIVDQVSAPILLLRLFCSAKILFYCHFPDQLLAQRRSKLHSLYRAPVDWFEAYTTELSHAVVVNSQFTGRVFLKTFLRTKHRPSVLYPAVDLLQFASVPPPPAPNAAPRPPTVASVGLEAIPSKCRLFLSINRFERKKGLRVAIGAFAVLCKRQSGGPASAPLHLVLAGGYDPRLAENVEHLRELKDYAESLQVGARVSFVPSFSAEQRAALLGACCCVVYTPELEHFGIVPLEAMAAGRAVLACNSGGPTESVRDGETGYLCEPSAEAFADAMEKIITDPEAAQRIGAAARVHVTENFSRSTLGESLSELLLDLHAGRQV